MASGASSELHSAFRRAGYDRSRRAGEPDSGRRDRDGTLAPGTRRRTKKIPKTKTFKVFAYSDGVGTFTVDSVAGWKPGDLFHILGDSAVLRVSALDGETGIRVASVEAANGSASPDENDMTYQVEKAMDEANRRMNSAFIFGPKRRGEGVVKPLTIGGLCCFGTQEGGLSLAQVGTPRLSIGMINRAAQLITDVGCVPDTIVCGTGQAQVISTFMNSQVTVNQADTSRGAYVEQIVSAAGGVSMKVFVEPAIPDGDVWVCDTRGFNLIPLRGRALHSSPATNPSSDGERAKLIGGYAASEAGALSHLRLDEFRACDYSMTRTTEND